MLEKMKNMLEELQNMSPEEFEVFHKRASKRASFILDLEYCDNHDFKIIGEEKLYCSDIYNLNQNNIDFQYDQDDKSKQLIKFNLNYVNGLKFISMAA
ncbi:MAG: hypothetical protein JJE21_08310 [Spirochaetaceae bacterium]|nr:hypothetical protein [Spirochaetaceae bacterium]